MNLLEKIADTLLSKHWIITLVSFVVSVVVSIFVPAELYDKLPFDSKVNVIIGFVAIAIVVFLVLYFFTWCIGKRFSSRKWDSEYQAMKKEEAEESIEEWRCFFDKITDEEYSIIMFFMKTENKRPYKTWGHRLGYSYSESIFGYSMEDQLFYKTKSYEKSPPYTVHYANEKKPRRVTSNGEATVYTLKDNVYRTFKEIIRLKGSLSHHPRKIYKLDYGNGSDLPEFQESKFNQDND